LGPLIQGQDGALYGVTSNGGAHGGGGTVFRITLEGVYDVLHSFGGSPTDGIVPMGGLVQGSDGDFYGVTASGGANHCLQIPQDGSNCGTVFKVTPAGDTTILHSFGSSPGDGITPTASLTQANDGNFYGTTVSGGANDCGAAPNSCGTVFRVTPEGITTTLHSFGTGFMPGLLPMDGIAPQSALAQGPDGALYGTTASGGNGRCGFEYGCGTVFRITLNGELTILHAFAVDSVEDGTGPSAYLILGKDGNLYGTTGSGGAYPDPMTGTVFRMSLSGLKTTLFSFGPTGNQPTNPVAGVIEGSDGAFYGVTAYSTTAGGTGTVFRLVMQ
ncbi:MAG TPA: choice-of-anchor tandem repeat GloVer-containing protein, partial [Steroidobacteraceae bacterium]|nr:choice-of-anchor tandem repeat GloVer-containing protein [Steroidobacteraceae bacterium]